MFLSIKYVKIEFLRNVYRYKKKYKLFINFRILKTVILKQDIFTGKDAVLGYVTIDMSTVYCSPKVEIDAWTDLIRSSNDTTTQVSI